MLAALLLTRPRHDAGDKPIRRYLPDGKPEYDEVRAKAVRQQDSVIYRNWRNKYDRGGLTDEVIVAILLELGEL